MNKLWIDDEKPAPDGWSVAKSYHEAIGMITQYDWDLIAIDHDLGEEGSPTGYDILCHMEAGALPRPKQIVVISWNTVGAKRMLKAIENMPGVENLGWDLKLSTSGYKDFPFLLT